MKYQVEGKCILELEHKPGMLKSKHIQTKFNLDVSDELDKSQYLTPEDLPTAVGTKVLSNVFVQGLIGNIHQAHQNGFWDSAEHLRYIIAELERGFIEIASTDSSTF